MTEAAFRARRHTPPSQSDAGGLANDTATFASRTIITGTLVQAMHFVVPTHPSVIPAKAGIQNLGPVASIDEPARLDPRLRGDDGSGRAVNK
jgi:hypothetical protein